MISAPEWLTEAVRTVPGFPSEGINFYDLAPVWESSATMSRCAIALAQQGGDINSVRVNRVLGIEARGFIFGMAVAQRLGVGFVAARKPGKTPPPFATVSYDLEYGSDAIELSGSALEAGDQVLIVDDLVATGGSACAGIDLVQGTGAEVVGVSAVIELDGLPGRKVIEAKGVPLHALWLAAL